MQLHGLSDVPEIIRTELTTEKTQEHVARKYYGDLQSLSIPYAARKIPATTRSLSSSGTYQ